MGDIIYVVIAGVYEDEQLYNVNTDIENIVETYLDFVENEKDSLMIEFWKDGHVCCPIYSEYHRHGRCPNEINKETIRQDILKYIEENKYYN